MGVPAFYRWLSEKYPKCVTDVLEERVHLAPDGVTPVPIDATKPSPSGLEVDNLYLDMNGIIHPCSHPEHGPQPKSEGEMYANVCRYVDRLFDAVRPRKLLFLAIDGVAPRAKMNQQRSRRFKAAQDAREQLEVERSLAENMITVEGLPLPKSGTQKPWDSNVITPGTTFMVRLAEFVRFYIRVRMSTNPAWQKIKVLFSDASVPGEGEHKIMDHVRRQRAQPGYDPNTVHVLHGLDADLIMLALATHEAHFYILREEVVFGRRAAEKLEESREKSGFAEKQRALDEDAGVEAMELPENKHKTLQRLSIATLREYLRHEFACCIDPRNVWFARRGAAGGGGRDPFERVVDDIVFLCFFVGNDFLPHLPSLDIRDGALDFLFNVYKKLLPGLGDYITKDGGDINLTAVDVILSEVGSIEDMVFRMRKEREDRDKERRKNMQQNGRGGRRRNDDPAKAVQPAFVPAVKGRAARALERANNRRNGGAEGGGDTGAAAAGSGDAKDGSGVGADDDAGIVPIKRKVSAAENTLRQKRLRLGGGGGDDAETKGDSEKDTATSAAAVRSKEENARAALELKVALSSSLSTTTADRTDGPISGEKGEGGVTVEDDGDAAKGAMDVGDEEKKVGDGKADDVDKDGAGGGTGGNGEEDVEEIEEVIFEDDVEEDDDDEDEDEEDAETSQDEAEAPTAEEEAAAKKILKERVKKAEQDRLDNFARTVQDTVRLHEAGWKDRYYKDKCKADDIEGNGGREELFRSYVMGLVWVMKYYYTGVCSWKWYFPFHYAPFASDLKNIERFEKDCSSFQLNEPFRPVDQLMAVLPEDSAHAVPKASRWLMRDPESPIIDFYPKEVPCDPNGKAMPWLWVVLLPFIDEERLLAALKPTMEKWTNQERLCNSRGLEDGYLYVHSSHPLAETISDVVTKDMKRSLGDASRWGGFSGSVRPPLSHERVNISDTVEPPRSSSLGGRGIRDELGSSLEENGCVCAAFSEPRKLPHRSIVLHGSRVPKPILQPQDLILRRPRLNRGGQTIANMGGAPNPRNSHSMHHNGNYGMNSHNRQWSQQGSYTAQPSAGGRNFGAMQPAPIRGHGQHRPDYRGGGQQQYQQRHQPPPPPPGNASQYGIRPPPPRNFQPSQQQQHGHHRQAFGGGRGYASQQSHSRSSQYSTQNRSKPYQPQHRQEHQRQQPYGGHGQHQQQHPPPAPPPPQYQHQQVQNQQYNMAPQPQYRGGQMSAGSAYQQNRPHASTTNTGSYSFDRHGRGREAQPQQQQRSGVNPNLMNSLRSQLASTLQQNRRRGGGAGR